LSAEARCGVGSKQYRRRQRPLHRFLLFLHHARGSLFEVEAQLTIAELLGYVAQAEVHRIGNSAGEVARMLNGLIKAISSTESKQAA
jgi:four helix bundle protein